MYLLDEFFVYKNEEIVCETPLEVQLHPHTSVGPIEIYDDLIYTNYSKNDPASKLPLGIFEAKTVNGNATPALNIQPETPNQMSIVITAGMTKFQTRLDANGIVKAHCSNNGDKENKTCCHVMKSINVTEKLQKDRILNMIGNSVFKNLALHVTLESDPEEDSDVGSFITLLRNIPSLHFEDHKKHIISHPKPQTLNP